MGGGAEGEAEVAVASKTYLEIRNHGGLILALRLRASDGEMT